MPLADRTVLHHRRREGGVIESRTVGQDTVMLDPPGLGLADLFPAEET